MFRKVSCDAVAEPTASLRASLRAVFTGGAGGLVVAYGKASSNRLKATGRMAVSGSQRCIGNFMEN